MTKVKPKKSGQKHSMRSQIRKKYLQNRNACGQKRIINIHEDEQIIWSSVNILFLSSLIWSHFDQSWLIYLLYIVLFRLPYCNWKKFPFWSSVKTDDHFKKAQNFLFCSCFKPSPIQLRVYQNWWLKLGKYRKLYKKKHFYNSKLISFHTKLNSWCFNWKSHDGARINSSLA